MSNRKVILYIAQSLDGYIAGPDDDLSFLSAVEQEGEDYGYGEFIETVDTVIMGRRTYDWVMRQVGYFPHADKEAYILTRTPKATEGKTHFYNGDISALVHALKQKQGGNIFCDGGADVVHALLAQHLIDEFVISIIPVLLGDGIQLFKDGRPTLPLQLESSRHFPSGLVQLKYIKPKS
jgi:dihydrofolate reductase